MVRGCIRMLRIPFEWLEFGFDCFESLSNGQNLHTNSQNPVRTFRFWIGMLRTSFEWLEFGFKLFKSFLNGIGMLESLSNGQNLHSNASNPFQTVTISIQMLRLPFQWLEIAFECFKSLLNGQNLVSNTSNPF